MVETANTALEIILVGNQEVSKKKRSSEKSLFQFKFSTFPFIFAFLFSSFPCEDGSLLICDVLGETSVYNKKRPRV